VGFETIYNLAGPVYVEDAKLGDTLEVEILALEPGDWGWTAIIPEFGLLPRELRPGLSLEHVAWQDLALLAADSGLMGGVRTSPHVAGTPRPKRASARAHLESYRGRSRGDDRPLVAAVARHER
jgi:acetamidase/formamidase